MSEERSLLDRHKAVMPSWLALYYDEPLALDRGEGCYVWGSDGEKYLDFFGGILTTMTGHSVPEVVDAINEQAARILHSSTLYLIEPAIELAEKIIELSPVDDARAFFVCSGTEANEAAMLLATTYRRSNQVIALRNSYHGRSFAAVAVTGNRGWSASSLSPVNVSYVQNGYRYRSPFGHLSDSDFIKACADDLRNIIETTTSGDVACMIAEPIQGVGGFATPPDGFFAALKEVLDEYGILLISDEVQTGWGRTGDHFWGIEAHDVRPDIMTFAKGIGNGLALGGVVARADIMDSVHANSISTFGGNPLSTAGALANLNYLLDNDLQTNARKVGEHLFVRLRELAEKHPMIGDVRGKGLMLGVELVVPGGKEPDAGAAGKVMEQARKGGLLIGKGGLYGNVVRMAPPLSLTLEQADDGFEALSRAIAIVSEEAR
ncbi:MAG: aspartate aminotransferase family protein [Actinobacteria bacterium]|nr:aspartate aminotransferase family protein [Actinomycetota bacterium]